MILSLQVGQYLEFGVRTIAEDFLSNGRFMGSNPEIRARPALNERVGLISPIDVTLTDHSI